MQIKEKNPREFLIARYTRPNDSFPTKLDVMVNGHVGILVEGRNCILPRFLIDSAKESHQFLHRPRQDAGSNQTDQSYTTKKVHPVIDTFEIDDEYQSPEGIMKLIELAKSERSETSPMFQLRSGVKELVYGDMASAERRASEEVAKSPKLFSQDAADLSKIMAEKDKKIADLESTVTAMGSKMDRILAMMESKPEQISGTGSGKAYKAKAGKQEDTTKQEEAPVYTEV